MQRNKMNKLGSNTQNEINDLSGSYDEVELLGTEYVFEEGKRSLVDKSKNDKNDNNGKEKEVFDQTDGQSPSKNNGGCKTDYDGEGTQDFGPAPIKDVDEKVKHDLTTPPKRIGPLDGDEKINDDFSGKEDVNQEHNYEALPHQCCKRFAEDIEDVGVDRVLQPAIKKLKISSSPSICLTTKDTRNLISSNALFQHQLIPSSKDGAEVVVPPVEITKFIISPGGDAHIVQASPTQKYYNNNISTVLPNNSNANKAPETTNLFAPATSSMLSTLTDDMFVLETTSFVVPYIYEKPPIANLKDIVKKIGMDLAYQQSKEPEEKTVTRNRKNKAGVDDSWEMSSNGSDTSTSTSFTDDGLEDGIKKTNTNPALNTFDTKTDSYFESPLGIFFMDIGINLVQEHVFTDLQRQEKHKFTEASTEIKKKLATIKMKNSIFKFKALGCEKCNFKSESELSIAYHNEIPHHIGRTYECNLCKFGARKLSDVTSHMDAIHNIKARLEKTFFHKHQCPYCPYQNSIKARLARHVLDCADKFRLEVNLSPPLYWDPPGRNCLIDPQHRLVETETTPNQADAAQRYASSGAAKKQQCRSSAKSANVPGHVKTQTLSKTSLAHTVPHKINTPKTENQNTLAAGSPQLFSNMNILQTAPPMAIASNVSNPRTSSSEAGMHGNHNMPLVLPSNMNATLKLGSSSQSIQSSAPTHKSLKPTQSSILSYFTKSPRQPASLKPKSAGDIKPVKPLTVCDKPTIVICEICESYINDLNGLQNHMLLIHKLKMPYIRPPLLCLSCNNQFFTVQGMERHLLDSHCLVTSSTRDAGRCSVCKCTKQSKLLEHFRLDHYMLLKNVDLLYKCSFCVETFSTLTPFETHVSSAHSAIYKFQQ